MMMQTIREKTRYAIVFLAVAFAAWLAFEGIQSRETTAATGSNPVIGIVNGEQIRFGRWRDISATQLNRARAQKGGPLTDEEARQAEEDAWEQMIRLIVIEQEIERIGIKVTDGEISQAFRVSPPPDLARDPAFQTDGQFDYAKYQAFFADPSVDEQLLRAIEDYYRDEIPRRRFEQQLLAGVAVSDAEAWQEFRAQNETAVVTYVSVDPASVVADTDIEVTESDAQSYYREHREDFERPATATVRLISVSTVPTGSDTTAARELADSVRTEILEGRLEFDAAAAEFSADTATGSKGGVLGRYTPDQLVEPINTTVVDLGVGDVSEPVRTAAGFHLLRVTDRTADTSSVSHIVFPIELSTQGEDELFGRMDDVEGVALDQGLTAAADSLDVPMRDDVTLTDGFDFVPGAGSLGVAVDWALDPNTLLGELSEFYENGSGFHIVELVSRTEAGTFDFADVRDRIETVLRAERRGEAARRIVEQQVAELGDGGIESLAADTGWPLQTTESVTRRQFVPGLGRDTEALGAAFASPIGVTDGPFAAGENIVVLRVDRRTDADAQLFDVMKSQLRAQMEAQLSQRRAVAWIEALREQATVVDHRDRLNQEVDQVAIPPLI
ncbi:MAG: SurA N-terminal domain-containing protein [Gemmatimonadota bacterium]